LVTVNGQRLAVMRTQDWEVLVEWLEDLEDAGIAPEAFAALKRAGGGREKAGWLKWKSV
jgi:hypothetical protein